MSQLNTDANVMETVLLYFPQKVFTDNKVKFKYHFCWVISYSKDRSFFMGRGGGGGGAGFWGGIRKFSSLKGGGIPKVEGGRGFLQVNVLVWWGTRGKIGGGVMQNFSEIIKKPPLGSDICFKYKLVRMQQFPLSWYDTKTRKTTWTGTYS